MINLFRNIIYDIREILHVQSDLEEMIENVEKGNLKLAKGDIILNSAGLPNPYYNQVFKEFKEVYKENQAVYDLTVDIYYFFNRKKRSEFFRGMKKYFKLNEKNKNPKINV